MEESGHIGIVTVNPEAIADIDVARVVGLASAVVWHVDGSSVLGETEYLSVGVDPVGVFHLGHRVLVVGGLGVRSWVSDTG